MTLQGPADDLDFDSARGEFDLEPSRLSGAILGGRYQVVGYLSHGATSRVYVARDLSGDHGRVVVKVLSPEVSERAEFRELMLREAHAALSINHPNVVRVLDLNDGASGPVFVVMEALVGNALGDLLRRGPLPAARALELGCQICRGLAAAHAAGVVHRDVKPDNVYVARQADGTDLVKVLDFGMAKIGSSSGSSAPHTVLGTAAYMSPEQSLAEPVDARSDIYSFGVLLFRMLTGHLPFEAESPADLLRHQLFSPTPPLGWLMDPVDPNLEAIVVNATRKSPGNRYASMAELLVDLEQVARGSEAAVPLRPLVSSPDAYEPLTDQGDRAVSLLAKKFGQYARVPELRSRIRKSTDT
jgi:serine/threonine-protein kinase